MQDYQVINKIKKLEIIKPDKGWVISTKQQILGFELDHSKVSTLDWFFIAFKKPVLVLSALLIVVVVAGGFLFSGSQGTEPKIADNNGMLASLQNLEAKLGEISLSLDNLEKATDQSQALVMAGIIKSTASGIEQGVSQIETNDYKEQVLAVQTASQGVIEAAGAKQKEMIEFLIDDLKERTLSQDNQERLEKLEQDYNNGEYDQAMIWIQMINNN
ncbi:MAG: hypothetical protein ACTSQA_04095 [Candidatus Heimdallarchaeaceae archaeon]